MLDGMSKVVYDTSSDYSLVSLRDEVHHSMIEMIWIARGDLLLKEGRTEPAQNPRGGRILESP